MAKIIFNFDELEEGKVYKITHASFSRRDNSHWSNWRYYIYRIEDGVPITVAYYQNHWADGEWIASVAPMSYAKHYDSLKKQLYKEIKLDEYQKRIILSAVMRGALVYKS